MEAEVVVVALLRFLLFVRETQEGWNCRFQQTPRAEGGCALSNQGSWAGLPFHVPEILKFVAFRDSGKIFQQIQFSLDLKGPKIEKFKIALRD